MLHFKAAPDFPKLFFPSWVAELRCVLVNAARPVHLPKHGFHLGVANAGVFDSILWQVLNGLIIDLSGSGLTEELGRLPHQNTIHLEHVLLLHSLGSTVVDGQGMPCQAMLLFQLGVEHVEPPGKLGRYLLNGLFEEISGAFQLAAAIPFHKLGEVFEPNVADVWPRKDLDTSLIDLEGILEILSVLQKSGIAQDQCWRGHLELQSRIIGCSCGGGSAQRLLKVDAKGPELGGTIQAILHGVLIFLQGCGLLLAGR
mmetsp:Transcript_20235/g.42278  ORF Transcript_20235/g.42278 Transcript_20235/m.42278 type:complete len:256 (-) Transcript_20235:250-1017(-)